MSYQLRRDALGNISGVIRLADGLSIPANPGNLDWLEFLAWDATPGNDPSAQPVPAVTDYSVLDVHDKAIVAAVLAAAALSNKTPAEARAAFALAYNALP